jgi:hypothetical protein
VEVLAGGVFGMQRRDITELGLSLPSLKQRIRECREREEMETDPVKKAGLRKECESLENHEIALVREMRELKEERQRLARSS